MTSVELCPKCHTSVTLTSYESSFEKDFVRAYQNPTQSEASCIESSLGNLSTELAALSQEIKRIESMLDALKAHHAHLDRHIQRSAQYLRSSPIRRLPVEVLGIVFASACTSFQRSEYKTPLSISLVCSKWRDIALSTPSLWTHIYVKLHSGGLDVYQHYLKRCGNIPLFVQVEIPYKERPTIFECDENLPYEETRDYHIELVSTIYQSCARWKVAELRMNLKDVNLLTCHSATPEFPVLESLTLVNDGPVNHLDLDLFNQASSLTSFMVLDREGGTIGFNFYLRAVPWRQIREVCTQSDVCNLSDEFEDGNTRTLVLRPHRYGLRYGLDLPTHATAPVSLRISALVLDSVIWTISLPEFFQFVTIPTLQSLTMMPPDPYVTHRHFAPSEWTNPFSALPEFLARSGCALQMFTIIMRGRYDDEYYAGRSIFGFATVEPTLADSLVVALHTEEGPSLFSERLFQEMTEGHLLPKLTSLEMVWAEGRQPADALIPMLMSRGGQGGAGKETLSSVVLGVRKGGDLRSDVLSCMANNLRQHGVRATLW